MRDEEDAPGLEAELFGRAKSDEEVGRGARVDALGIVMSQDCAGMEQSGGRGPWEKRAFETQIGWTSHCLMEQPGHLFTAHTVRGNERLSI